MKILRKKPPSQSVQPKEGDTLVTLSTHSNIALEDKMDLLGYSFAKVIQGAVLRRIVKWDLKNGRIQFVVGDGPAGTRPRGTVLTELEHYDISYSEQRLGASRVS